MPFFGMNITRNKKMHKIFIIHNLDELLPHYPHHWVILAQKQPVMEYETSKPSKSIHSYL